MSQESCPRCWGPLVVRNVSPCFVCGAWDPDPRGGTRFSRYRLPSGNEIVLCTMCYLEDFCSDQSEVPAMLGVREVDLVMADDVDRHPGEVDKVCEKCGFRLALLKIAGERGR